MGHNIFQKQFMIRIIDQIFRDPIILRGIIFVEFIANQPKYYETFIVDRFYFNFSIIRM